MKKILCVIMSLFMIQSFFGQDAVFETDADKVIDNAYAILSTSGNDFSCTVSLLIKKSNENDSELKYKLFQREKENQFSLIQLFPESEKGNGYLKENDNLWSYDPIGRKFSHTSLKENIGDSDMNFSDYDSKISWKEDFKTEYCISKKLGQYDVWVVGLKAKTNRPSYSKFVYYVRKDIPLVLKIENYNNNERLMRTILMPKYVQFNSTYVASKTIVRDEIAKGETTIQELSDISFEILPDRIFTKAYLEQIN